MKTIKFVFLASVLIFSCQNKDDSPESLSKSITSLEKSIASEGGEKAWSDFKSSHTIPFSMGDSIAFFYYGDAQKVQWAGDFNSWSSSEPKAVGKKIKGSSIWYTIITLPGDARVDYKIIVDGNWILDPDNKYKQMTGVGGGTYNSELRMPEFIPDTTGRKREVDKGNLTDNILLQSKNMGYGIYYRVYTPAGYDSLNALPSLYVTDGQEYGHPEMGNMVNILNNLIFDKKIKPLIVILIDPRNPENLNENRRMTELVLNSNYLKFVTDELIPEIDAQYKTSKDADERGILGTSLGGLNSAYFFSMAPQTFHLIGINSPAFQYKPAIFDLYDTLQAVPEKVIMTTGVVHDTEVEARRMKGIMESKNYPLKYIEINQGHSWGNWKSLLDDVLIYLYGN